MPRKSIKLRRAVLVADSDPRHRAAALALFATLGVDTYEASTGAFARQILDDNILISALFVAPELEDMPASELVASVIARRPDLQIVLAAGYVLG